MPAIGYDSDAIKHREQKHPASDALDHQSSVGSDSHRWGNHVDKPACRHNKNTTGSKPTASLYARFSDHHAGSLPSQLFGRGRPGSLTLNASLLPSTVAESPAQQMYYSTSQASAAGLSQGDTQVEPSYVYEKYTKEGRAKFDGSGQNESNGRIALASGITPETYGTSDTGHIDLVHNFEIEEGVDVDMTERGVSEGVEEDGAKEEDEEDFDELSQSRVEFFPEAKRFQQPKTPATHGKKRNYNGAVVTPVLPTNPFGDVVAGSRGVMPLSQVFGATQAASSPLLQRIPSDQISERPSPDFFNAHNSPKIAISSSPVKFSKTVLKYIPGEPMTTYISMVESQEERERLQRMKAAHSPDAGEDSSSDDGFSSDGSARARIQRLKAKRESAIEQSFAGVSAPPRGGRVTKRQHREGRLEQSNRRGATLKNAMLLSDDLEANTDGRPASSSDNDTEHEREVPGLGRRIQHGKRAASDNHSQNSNGVQVPRTLSREIRGTIACNGSQSTPSGYKSKDVPELAIEPAAGILIEPVSGQVSHNSSGSTEKIDIVIGGTQTIAVADSQPSLPEPETSDPQPPDDEAIPALPTSVDSRLFASQSQFNSLAMNARVAGAVDPNLTVIENSSIPQPPRSPSQICTSSPLVVRYQSRSKLSDIRDMNAVVPPTTGVRRPFIQPVEVPRATLDPMSMKDGELAAKEGFGTESDNTGNCAAETRKSTPPAAEETPSILSANPRRKDLQSGSPLTTTNTMTPRTTRTRRGEVVPGTSSAGRCESTSPANSLTNSGPQHLRTPLKALDEKLESVNKCSRDSTRTTVHKSVQKSLRPSISTGRAEICMQSPTPIRPAISSSHGASRTLTEIAADPSPPDPLGSIDMDVGLFTNEDVAFQATINGSSPVRLMRKRRQGIARAVLDEPKEQVNKSSPEAPPSPDHQGQKSAGPAFILTDAASRPGPVLRKYGKGKAQPPKKKLKRSSNVAELDDGPTTRAVIPQVAEPAKTASDQSNRNESPKASSTVKVQPGTKRRRVNMNERLIPDGSSSRGHNTPCISSAPKLDAPVVVPGRVLAWFRGRKLAYYPATCIKEEGTQSLHHVVRFDDGTIDTLETQHLRRLELRLGDTVKVDIETFRKKNFAVSGFKDRLAPVADVSTPSRGVGVTPARAQEYPLTDVYGYATVLLTPKQRESSAGEELTNNHEKIEFPITSIYITGTMWAHFSDRTHHRLSATPTTASRLHTPALQSSVPTTPSSRTRRLAALALAPSRASVLPTELSTKGPCLFSGMAFAVTYLGEDAKKDRVIKQISQHGGRILLDGFEELFKLERLQPLSPSEALHGETNQSLSLTQNAETLGFVCLIADKHSRRAKYIQALAIGLPCLSGRWVADCVAKGRIIDWEPYLLPSGESSFLDGATRSRILQAYPAESARFSNTLERRSRLLHGRSVLLIMGKGKAEEPRKAYVFLTYVLGASRVCRVVSVDAARKALADDVDYWDWVYVDRNEASVEKALLLKPEAGKKRKRGVEENNVNGNGTAVKKVKVVGNEFVIQSLILGRLLEDD
ncbi:MAG: hypothetical protein M1812_000276 [Candelaria pacifica]|nr:MAG: hypothetical protein M1812_000276 [Candelaria pacifica]